MGESDSGGRSNAAAWIAVGIGVLLLGAIVVGAVAWFGMGSSVTIVPPSSAPASTAPAPAPATEPVAGESR